MVPVQEMLLGEAGPSPTMTISILQSSLGGILHQTQIMLWDIDLNHQSSSCLHNHEAHHNQFPDLCLSHLFGQLPDEGLPLRYFCCQLHHINAFSGEMLAQVNTAGVMDRPHHHLYISLCHLLPVLHHKFLQGHDS